MTTLREAAQKALEALEDMLGWESLAPQSVQASSKQSLQRLREALAHPDPEPVTWMVYTLDGKSAFVTDNPKDFTQDHRALPLYTHPPQREPLTDKEIDKLIAEHVRITDPNLQGAIYMAMRDLEAAHGIVEIDDSAKASNPPESATCTENRTNIMNLTRIT